MEEIIKKCFPNYKYLVKESIQRTKYEKELDWILNNNLIYVISENNIIYLKKNMYVLVDLKNQIFTLTKVSKQRKHNKIVYGDDLSEVIKVAEFELANDLEICLN